MNVSEYYLIILRSFFFDFVSVGVASNDPWRIVWIDQLREGEQLRERLVRGRVDHQRIVEDRTEKIEIILGSAVQKA